MYQRVVAVPGCRVARRDGRPTERMSCAIARLKCPVRSVEVRHRQIAFGVKGGRFSDGVKAGLRGIQSGWGSCRSAGRLSPNGSGNGNRDWLRHVPFLACKPEHCRLHSIRRCVQCNLHRTRCMRLSNGRVRNGRVCNGMSGIRWPGCGRLARVEHSWQRWSRHRRSLTRSD